MSILCGAILAVAAVVSQKSEAGIVVYPEYDSRIGRDCAYAVCVVQGRTRRSVPVCNRCGKSMPETRTRGGFSAAVEDMAALADLGGLACSLQP